MNAFSEIIGSFKRVGPFPIETNYIFETTTALKDFFTLPENNAILHKGLLKIVEDDGEGNQALYWVTRKATTPELEFTKLITSNSDSTIKDLLSRLDEEIKHRIDGDDAIWGTRDHSLVPDEFNSLLEIAKAITDLRDRLSKVEAANKDIDNKFKAIIGTTEEDYIAYLNTLDYKSLANISTVLHKFLEEVDPHNEKINTLPELQAFLTGYKDTDTLAAVLKAVKDDIWGTPVPSADFRTLRGIEDFIRLFMADTIFRDNNIQKELDQTQVGVGLSGDGAYNPDNTTTYLKTSTSVMNSLKILDGLINDAINNTNIVPESTSTVAMSVIKTIDKTVLSADVKISSLDGNGVISKSDGMFYKLTTDYSNGILTIKVNDNIIGSHSIALPTIVEDARYDPTTEDIIIVFKLLDGGTQTLRIPVGTLIREWTVDNSYPDKVVVLEKVETLGGGSDKLSADVRLYVDKYNILVKKDNSLYVKGTTDNITHSSTSLDKVILAVENNIANNTNGISSNKVAISSEIARATGIETVLRSDLNREVTTREATVTAVDNRVTTEVARAQAAEKVNSDAITKESLNRIEGNAVLTDSIVAETNRSLLIEASLKSDISLEATNRSSADAILTTGLTDESARAKEAERITNEALIAETLRATTAEGALKTEVTNLTTSGGLEHTALNNKIANETLRATAEEARLLDRTNLTDTNLTAEIARAVQVEQGIQVAVTGLTTLTNNHIGDTNNPHKVAKADVGLENVDNTSDASKPISTLQQAKFTTIDNEINLKAAQKDLVDHTSNHANPHAVTKAQVNLDNVDNTSDINKPISTATQAALNLKAALVSPIFTGTPTTPTPDDGDKSLRVANTLWVERTIGGLIWGSYD